MGNLTEQTVITHQYPVGEFTNIIVKEIHKDVEVPIYKDVEILKPVIKEIEILKPVIKNVPFEVKVPSYKMEDITKELAQEVKELLTDAIKQILSGVKVEVSIPLDKVIQIKEG